jgi:hypothetical protein
MSDRPPPASSYPRPLASIISDALHDSVAAKADVQALGTELKAELTAQVAATRSELKADIQASETALIERLNARLSRSETRTFIYLGSLMVVLTGVLFAALHYWPPGHG